MRFRVEMRMLAIALTLLTAIAPAAQAQAVNKRNAAVQAVTTIRTTVADMERSIAFYGRVLSFQKISDREIDVGEVLPGRTGSGARVVGMRLGNEAIELMQFRSNTGQPIPKDSRSNDYWFQHIAIIVSDLDRACRVLQANQVGAASIAPQRLPDWNKNAAGIRAFYFKDPDGHPLEILQFPADKGDRKWHRSAGRLFLGIDHTAIVVSDTEASLRFYRDALGMHIAGESDNYGREQERLNNVPGAHLRITSLRAEQGPGIELLEYLSPRTGRRLPKDPEVSDLVYRETVLTAADPAALAAALRNRQNLTAGRTEDRALMIRDPDGHALRVRAAEPERAGEK
jgi:catechol 2,3-dioxygenase-like lactoylglutathione lyase family enzyme